MLSMLYIVLCLYCNYLGGEVSLWNKVIIKSLRVRQDNSSCCVVIRK